MFARIRAWLFPPRRSGGAFISGSVTGSVVEGNVTDGAPLIDGEVRDSQVRGNVTDRRDSEEGSR